MIRGYIVRGGQGEGGRGGTDQRQGAVFDGKPLGESTGQDPGHPPHLVNHRSMQLHRLSELQKKYIMWCVCERNVLRARVDIGRES